MNMQDEMVSAIEKQRIAIKREGNPTAETRIDRIRRAINLLQTNGDMLCDAMSTDFGHRSTHQSRMTDIAAAVLPLKHAKKNLRRWMKREKRSTFPFSLLGAKGEIQYQPLGVVGVITPWNFPVQLTFSPLAGIFAAGNRIMLKPSEYTPFTSELIQKLIRSNYDEEEVAVFLGGTEVGNLFSSLPFDHLLFTGSTNVAKKIMRAAAENLVPVTLELGGKSPVIIGKNANIKQAARSIMAGKTLNAGQICLAPDYIFIQETEKENFLKASRECITKMYPTLRSNPDYTSIINNDHYERLKGYVEEARSAGFEVIELNSANEEFNNQPHHRIPPTLIINPSDDLKVMQDEIFGPILPIKTYEHIAESIEYINNRARPLGLYYFGYSKAECGTVLRETISGGVTVNDVIMHVTQEELPFGGVGASGMGVYHGYDGFKTFSHGKSIYHQSQLLAKLVMLLNPPYE